MTTALAFILGWIIGGIVGFFGAALCVAAKRGDEMQERQP